MTKLTILHTNDIHGRVEQLERIGTLAREIRREVAANGRVSLLLDGGDVEDLILFESSMTKGSAPFALLKGAGYDQAALGNASPMRYGEGAIPDLAARFGKPILAANMFVAGSDQLLPGLAAFALEQVGDTKVALIGMTATSNIYDIFSGVRVVNPTQVLPGLISQVRSMGARTVILVSHLGHKDDTLVAEQVKGIDIIIGGHSHTELNPPLVMNDVIIAQAGDKGRWLGRLDIELNEQGRVVQHNGTLLPVTEDIAPDPNVEAAFAKEQERVCAIAGRVIGILNDPLDLAEQTECAASNVLADALLERVQGAELAMVLAGWQTGLDAGPLTVGALYNANRSSANPARVEITGAQILQFLTAALKPENAERRLQPRRGLAVGVPHVAGMTVHYDPAALEQMQVQVGDRPLERERTYVVAGTDWEFMDFGAYPGYLRIPSDQVDLEIPTTMPEALEDYISRHSPLSAPKGGRIAAIRR